MANPVRPFPNYRRHASGQAVVTVDGRDIYLGVHGSGASREKYRKLNIEWLQNHRQLPVEQRDPQDGITVVELIDVYELHAREYYRKNGEVTREHGCIVEAVKLLETLYGRLPAKEFKPLKLQAVRQAMIEAGWSRKYVNKQIGRIVRMFKWGVAQELVPGEIYHGLCAVDGLKAGRTRAPDYAPVAPVNDATVSLTLKQLQGTVADMVQIQRLTWPRHRKLRACGSDRSSAP